MIGISSARTSQLTGQTDNPFFAWDNLGAGAGVTYGGTATLTDGAAANAFTAMTTEYWKPNVTGATASLRVTFPTAVELKFIGLAAHNLFTLGSSVVAQYSTDSGATWLSTFAGTLTPTDNSPIGFRFATGVSTVDWRFIISGLTAGAPVAVGVAFFGTEMVMPQRFYDGFAPAISPTEVQLQANVTVGGQLAGTSVISKGSTLSAPFQYLDPTFIRGTFAPFQKAWNNGKPAFFAWRPATFSSDLHYVWREGDVIRPQNAGGLNYMAATVNMRAHEA